MPLFGKSSAPPVAMNAVTMQAQARCVVAPRGAVARPRAGAVMLRGGAQSLRVATTRAAVRLPAARRSVRVTAVAMPAAPAAAAPKPSEVRGPAARRVTSRAAPWLSLLRPAAAGVGARSRGRRARRWATTCPRRRRSAWPTSAPLSPTTAGSATPGSPWRTWHATWPSSWAWPPAPSPSTPGAPARRTRRPPRPRRRWVQGERATRKPQPRSICAFRAARR